MTPENKKIAMYVGGAVVVGAVGFFVYSFFQKPIVVGNTSVVLGNEEDKANTPINPFKETLAQSQSYSQTPFSDAFKNIDWAKEFIKNSNINTGIK